jgi:SAM-dependent methyltransferase
MSETVRQHYEQFPYPHYPLLASVRTCDTYALNLKSLWAAFNGALPPQAAQRILIAGCGSFSPYPFSLANPATEITALDLSGKSLNRARLHCLLHGCFNVRYQTGDLLNASVAPGPFGLIDAYGVLHHLDDPQAGFRALAARLVSGGFLRVMIYNRYARREEESIRRAFRRLGVQDTARVKALIKRSPQGSRLRSFFDSSMEVHFDAGLADALLHPRVRTYRIDELVELIRSAGLELLKFAHYGALTNVEDEVKRIRQLEQRRESCGNFLIYLGKSPCAPSVTGTENSLLLNPCLRGIVGLFQAGKVHIPPRLGFENPVLGFRERTFLRSFLKPVALHSLDAKTLKEVAVYKKALFLIECPS